MHDIVDLESRGIPGVFVSTTEFVSGAVAQGEALGLDPARVHVTHPIQNRTDEEMVELADQWIDRIVEGLTGPTTAG